MPRPIALRTLVFLVLATAITLAGCGGGAGGGGAVSPVSIVVGPGEAPKIQGTPPLAVTAGSAFSFTPTASGREGRVLTFTISGMPSWASFDSATGQLSGVPTTEYVGPHGDVTITVSDGELSSRLPSFSIRVAWPAGEDRPYGIYSIDSLVDRPFVDGLLVRPRWSEMEPREGEYDFSKIETAVRTASAAGKLVTIASLVNFAPDWLRARSQQFQHLGETVIVPWDEAMLVKLEQLAQAQAAHRVDGVALRDHPSVRQINATVGGMTAVRLIELPSGYTSERFVAAVERSVAIWADAYPHGKHLYLALFGVNDGTRSPSTAEAIRERLLAIYDGQSRPSLHFFQELLTGQIPKIDGNLGQVLLGVNGRSGILFQACGPWSAQANPIWSCDWVKPSDSPSRGLQLGLESYGARYFEFYKDDLLHADYRDEFEFWRGLIDEARSGR